jgi:hypothetical protein
MRTSVILQVFSAFENQWLRLSDTLKKKSEQERFAVPARFNLGETLLFISAFLSSLL